MILYYIIILEIVHQILYILKIIPFVVNAFIYYSITDNNQVLYGWFCYGACFIIIIYIYISSLINADIHLIGNSLFALFWLLAGDHSFKEVEAMEKEKKLKALKR